MLPSLLQGVTTGILVVAGALPAAAAYAAADHQNAARNGVHPPAPVPTPQLVGRQNVGGSATTTPPSAITAVPPAGQCGGAGYTGPSRCASDNGWPATCVSVNESSSQCQACPIFSCAQCPSGSTQTFTSTGLQCPQCACLPATRADPTITPCPRVTCPGCEPGSTAAFTSTGEDCPTCTCFPTAPINCPTFSCAACPPGSSQIQTTMTNGCLGCGCQGSGSGSSTRSSGSSGTASSGGPSESSPSENEGSAGTSWIVRKTEIRGLNDVLTSPFLCLSIVAGLLWHA